MQPNQDNTEPSAEMRVFAGKMFETYTALVKAGFSADEALKIIGHILATAGRRR